MRPRVVRREEAPVIRLKTSRGCPCGKITYTSKKLAVAAAKRIRREEGDDTIEAYHAYGCHAWHIGHPPAPYDPEVARGLKPPPSRARRAS